MTSKHRRDESRIHRPSSTVAIDFKLADIKLESSEARLPKLEKLKNPP